MSLIAYGKQSISQEDIESVVEILKSDFLTQGPAVSRFEKALCEYTGAKYGVAVCNGTAALHIACLALGLGQNDLLWTVPNTFVASANCAIYCGAKVDFVDIDSTCWNIDVNALEDKLKQAEKSGRLPKILVVVHFAGMPADLSEIRNLSKQYGFFIIEDACHALGASYKNHLIGNCQYSDITVFSFHPVKSITCGEGGMAMTNDDSLADKMRLLSSHGITRDRSIMSAPSEDSWYYEQISLGYNYRLSDIHAGLGLSQLRRLDSFIEKRKEIANLYNRSLSELPLKIMPQEGDRQSAYHLYPVAVDADLEQITRQEIFDYLLARGIKLNVHYIPVHLQPFYRSQGFKEGDFPVAEQYYQNELSLPCYPELKDAEQKLVINVLQTCLS